MSPSRQAGGFAVNNAAMHQTILDDA